MNALKRILVPIDFSEASHDVLAFARLIADASGASLHLLHVISDPLAAPGRLTPQRDDACRRLTALTDRADRESRYATTSCEVGTTVETIVHYAREHAIDLIVMGTHPHGPTYSMATGSIAEGVLGLAPCAVLAVKDARAAAWEWGDGPHPTAATGCRDAASSRDRLTKSMAAMRGVQTCRWATPTLLLQWPLWYDAAQNAWSCVREGTPRTLADPGECRDCRYWALMEFGAQRETPRGREVQRALVPRSEQSSTP